MPLPKAITGGIIDRSRGVAGRLRSSMVDKGVEAASEEFEGGKLSVGKISDVICDLDDTKVTYRPGMLAKWISRVAPRRTTEFPSANSRTSLPGYVQSRPMGVLRSWVE